MEVATKVACGSVVAGGGGVAGAYGVHRLSIAHESEPETPAPGVQAEEHTDTRDDVEVERSDAEDDTHGAGEHATSGEAGVESTPGAAGAVTAPASETTPALPTTQGQNVDGDGGSQTQLQQDSAPSGGSTNPNTEGVSDQGEGTTSGSPADSVSGQTGK